MRKIILFIISCYSISILFGIIIWELKGNSNAISPSPYQLVLTVGLMFTPALVAYWIENKKFKDFTNKYQLNFKNINWKSTIKYLLITNIIIPILILGYGYFLGNFLKIEQFGELATSIKQVDPKLFRMPSMIFNVKYPLVVVSIIISVISLIAGCSVNALVALGEEIGWRGFLEKNIKLNFITKNILIGSIWGLWHAPIILCGHNFPNYPYWGILMMVFLCITLSFYYSFILRKTKSLFVMGALHGSFNAFTPLLAASPFLLHNNELFGPIGILMILTVLTISTISYIIDKKRIYEK
ncbi:CPBP family intramembrane metalloprotease [Flavobacterium sp. Arc3]|uniref:CPBP family intramembrane glutamic endopeptidase n=1 Tax=Flavobacterium sp. Arc3 TaxID=3046686 RepID=UPI00352E1DC5